jgi:hypothetical protein
LNKRGIVISWGGPTKGHHFNERTDPEIIDIFLGMGYVHDAKAEMRLRDFTSLGSSLKERILVFRRAKPTAS